MDRIKPTTGLIAVIALSLGFLLAMYGKVLLSPNQYVFNEGGDGIKNYYTYAYYIKNNSSGTNFEGLNYPYGEHYMYTDCHPGLASFLKVFPGSENYSIGILNFLMLISFVVASAFTYLLLTELKINRLLAILGAFALLILSPQVFRLSGHYALSYSCFIPITWYLLLRFENNDRKILFASLLGINIFFWLFTHAYLGVIASSMLLAYGFLKLLISIKSKSVNYKEELLHFAPVIVPVAIFMAFVSATDTHIGRTTNPYGYFEYYADFDTVFLANHGPLGPIVNSILPVYTQTWEGWSYLGLGTILVLMYYVFLTVRNSFQNKKIQLNNAGLNNKHLQIMLVGSSLILLFSMGYPFRFYLQEFLDYFPSIKQFRAIGRFSWVFFFVANVAVLFMLNEWIKRFMESGKKNMAYAIMIGAPMLLIIEGFAYHVEVSDNIANEANPFREEQLDPDIKSAISKINPKDYQAILPLPYYYIGSENFGKHGTNKSYRSSMLFSYHTNLPLMSTYTARTSLKESKKMVQLLSPGFYKKTIQKDLPSKKPILVIHSNEALSFNEQDLISKCKLLYQTPSVTVYELQLKDLFQNTAAAEIDHFNKRTDLAPLHEFLTNDPNGIVYYHDFERWPLKRTYRGTGAMKMQKSKHTVLTSTLSNQLEKGVYYTLSFWMYNDGPNFGQDQVNNMELKQQVFINGIPRTRARTNPRFSETIDGNWSLVELEFVANQPELAMQFVLEGYDLFDKTTYIDDMLIRKSGAVVYRVDKKEGETVTELYKNNHRIATDW
jgi:hypothetical protein